MKNLDLKFRLVSRSINPIVRNMIESYTKDIMDSHYFLDRKCVEQIVLKHLTVFSYELGNLYQLMSVANEKIKK